MTIQEEKAELLGQICDTHQKAYYAYEKLKALPPFLDPLDVLECKEFKEWDKIEGKIVDLLHRLANL